MLLLAKFDASFCINQSMIHFLMDQKKVENHLYWHSTCDSFSEKTIWKNNGIFLKSVDFHLKLISIIYSFSGPWINNCVGYRNHVHFLLFCVYMTMIAGYATLTGETQFQLVAFHDQKLFSLFDPILKTENMTMALVEHKTIGPLTGVLVMFLYLINLIAMGLIFSLTVWQCALISKGQTCVEEKIDKSVRSNTNQTTLTNQRRPYDLGCKQNWKNFFETDTRFDLIKRLLIPTQFQPKHDGTRWVSKFQDWSSVHVHRFCSVFYSVVFHSHKSFYISSYCLLDIENPMIYYSYLIIRKLYTSIFDEL